MKSALSVFALSLLLAGCASSKQSGPNVTVQLAQLNSSSNVFYFAGPVNIEYQLAITNPTNQPLTLTRLDLQTIGSGAYFLRNSGTPMNLKVAPNATTSYTISVWGQSRGGYLASGEPVTIRGTAFFQGPSGSFVRLFNQNISPYNGS